MFPTVKKLLLFSFLAGTLCNTTAQQLNGEFGVGLGWGFNSDDGLLPDDALRSPLRIIFQAGLNYEFDEHWGLGLELSTSVFQRLDIFALDPTTALEDGTGVLDPLRTYSSIIALKPRYTFEWKGFEPYVALGAGYNWVKTQACFNILKLNNYLSLKKLRNSDFPLFKIA